MPAKAGERQGKMGGGGESVCENPTLQEGQKESQKRDFDTKLHLGVKFPYSVAVTVCTAPARCGCIAEL